MSVIARTLATLRVIDKELDPEEITKLLGCEPTSQQVNGQVFVSKSGRERIARVGNWLLSSTEKEPGELDEQIAELLSKVTNDLAVWKSISHNSTLDLFCGLFMEKGIEGINISHKSLLALGERNIDIGLDVYGPDPEEA